MGGGKYRTTVKSILAARISILGKKFGSYVVEMIILGS